MEGRGCHRFSAVHVSREGGVCASNPPGGRPARRRSAGWAERRKCARVKGRNKAAPSRRLPLSQSAKGRPMPGSFLSPQQRVQETCAPRRARWQGRCSTRGSLEPRSQKAGVLHFIETQKEAEGTLELSVTDAHQQNAAALYRHCMRDSTGGGARQAEAPAQGHRTGWQSHAWPKTKLAAARKETQLPEKRG